MTRWPRATRLLALLVVAGGLGCGTDATGDAVAGSGGAPPGASGMASSGGTTNSGGSMASGGVLRADGGQSSGGTGNVGNGSGGFEAGGGLGSGGTGGSGGAAASGGTATGSGGSGGSGGASPEKSAGCGNQNKAASGTVTVPGDHIFTFPEGYDGTRPFPVFIGFHACNNPIDQFLTLTRGSRFEKEYIRVFPRSSDSGGCWNYGNDMARVTRVYDELVANHCVDQSRVFAAGHSSGAQLIVQILTHREAATHVRFKAVAPIAASDYGPLSAPEPVLYIQGKKDTVRGGDGAAAVARFRTANGCSATSTAHAPSFGCQSSGRSVNPGCVAYDACLAPTIWCSHDDPHYEGTSHGVPCFAVSAIADFFDGLR